MPRDESGLQDPFWRNLFTVCAVYAALIAVLAAACGCAWTDRELQDASETVGWFGQMFGPQGVVASGTITGLMILGVKVYRAWRGDPALTAMAAGTAAALARSKNGASDAEIAAILSESIPGTKTAVEDAHVKELVRAVSAKRATGLQG